MKYMILIYASQRDYDALSGKPPADQPGWSAADFAAMGTFMASFTTDLAESGELVDTRGLTAPAHARRIRLRDGAPVVTDGPYPESEEVLAGYWIVECAGKLQYRPSSMHGNPWLRLLRREVEDLVRTRHGERYLRERRARTEWARVNRELKQLRTQLTALEEGRPALLSELAEQG